jgi:hypothetical protein
MQDLKYIILKERIKKGVFHMKRSDEMIALATLYNKINAKYPNKEATARVFKEKAKELSSKGAISTEAVKDAFYCFIPEEREKQIQAIKDSVQKSEKGYSSKQAADRIESLIDEVLSDDIRRNSFGAPYEPDPCIGGRGCSSRSPC